MCELARNSVIQSGWEGTIKSHWLGHQWDQGINDVSRTNVPDIRIKFRQDTLHNELATLRRYVDYDKKLKQPQQGGGGATMPGMSLHDTVGLAGLAEPAKLQHHIHHHDHAQHQKQQQQQQQQQRCGLDDGHSIHSSSSKDDIHQWMAFPGAALAAERAKRKHSEPGKSSSDESGDHA